MPAASMADTRRWWRRNLAPRARDAYAHARPAVSLSLLAGGAWWTVHYLTRYPWHHMMIAWVVGAIAAGAGATGIYRQVAYRRRVRAWLEITDPAEAEAGLEAARKAARDLPARYRESVYARRRKLRAAGVGASAGSARQVAKQPCRGRSGPPGCGK